MCKNLDGINEQIQAQSVILVSSLLIIAGQGIWSDCSDSLDWKGQIYSDLQCVLNYDVAVDIIASVLYCENIMDSRQ